MYTAQAFFFFYFYAFPMPLAQEGMACTQRT